MDYWPSQNGRQFIAANTPSLICSDVLAAGGEGLHAIAEVESRTGGAADIRDARHCDLNNSDPD